MRWFKPREPADTVEVHCNCPRCYERVIIVRNRGETIKVPCPNCGKKIRA